MTVLVTGATGQVGRHVVEQLLAAGVEVRAMTRTPDAFRFPPGVEVVRGDLTEPADLAAALRGVTRMYLFPVPQAARAVAEQARRAGIRRVVVLSSSSVHNESSHSGAHHRAVERAVKDSGLDWTFIRPGEFATNILWKWGHSIRTEGLVRAPYPRARRSLLHEVDVAAVATTALVEDGHLGCSYELTGPEALDQAEQVTLIAQATGREIRFEETTPEAAKAELTRFMPEDVVDMVLKYLADSENVPPLILPTVERVTGRPATPFRRWARDHASDFVPG